MGRVHFEKFFKETICSENLHGFKHLRKALRWDPHNLHYLNQAGFYFVKYGYCRDKRIAWEGIRFYERSLRINPNQPEFLESLGALQIYMGNIQAGVRCFCQAIECTPGYTAAYLQLLDILQHFHYQELYKQWLSCSLFLKFPLFVAQPDLLAYLQTHTSVQQQFLNHFEELKQRYPEDYDDYLSFEYGLRKFLLHRTPLQLTDEQKKFFSWENHLRVLSWKHLSKNVIAKPFRRLYRLNLHQHSNPNVLLHGRQAQFIRMATLKEIYPTSGSGISAKKHAHMFLRPLIQATVQQFSEHFKK